LCETVDPLPVIAPSNPIQRPNGEGKSSGIRSVVRWTKRHRWAIFIPLARSCERGYRRPCATETGRLSGERGTLGNDGVPAQQEII